MNFILWICAGAAVGWAACLWLGWNTARGLVVSICMGAAGALIGGHFLAPVLGADVPEAADIGLAALLVAIVTATASLKVVDVVDERWGG